MTVRHAFLIVAVSIGLVCTQRARSDDARPAKSTTSVNEIELLVAELGDDLFSVRDSATNQLLKKGIAAKPLLVKAAKSEDAEVRMRAKRVLASVVEADFKIRLKAFKDDTDGSRQTTLPGWPEFKKLIGATQAARELFIEMQMAEPALLDAFEQGPKEVEAVLQQRSYLAGDKVQVFGRRGQMKTNVGSLGSTLAVLFVAGQSSVPVGEDVSMRVAALPTNDMFRSAITSNGEGTPRRTHCLKLLGQWVGRDVKGDAGDQNLWWAYGYNLKEGLSPAIHILQQAQSTYASKEMALLVASKFGGDAEAPIVAPYLNDSHVCQEFGVTNTPMQTQLRDLALLATIKLNRQDPKSFGFPRSDVGISSTPNFHTIAFSGDEERNAAFKKWEAWQTAQKNRPTEKTADKSSREKPQ